MNREMGLLSPATYLKNSDWLFEENKVTKWTPEENKMFENALALFDKDTPDRWHNVAAMIPGKTVNDVIKQYKELEEDVSDIEAGLIPVPGYSSNSFTLDWVNKQGYDGLKQIYGPVGKRNSSIRCSDHERKKGVPWTEEEHRQFLLGLKKYGKGDWRSIAHNLVTTRTPTQVASHAQKYFLRQLSGGKDKRRSSIHDITTVNLTESHSPSPDKNRNRLPDKSTLLKQLQRNSNVNCVVQGRYGSNMTNPGAMMGFSTPNSSLIMTHLQGSTPSAGLNLQEPYMLSINQHGLRLEHHGTVLRMQPTHNH